MKLLSFAAIVAGAGIAQVLAAPLLLIPTNAESTPFKIRFGHAVPACFGKGSFVAHIPSIMNFHHSEASNGEMTHRKFRFGHAVPVPAHRVRKHSFVNRIHHSLMHLGHWEGRAVAFVLGCGIGVLLRMIWVLALVMYRAVKGRRGDEHEYSQIIIAEEIVDTPKSSPPTYTYLADEKVVVTVDTAKAPITTEASTTEASTTKESK